MTEPAKTVVVPPADDKVEPTPPTPPVVKEKVTVTIPRETVIYNRLGEILAEHDGMESNIPATKNEYWNLKRELNAIRASAR